MKIHDDDHIERHKHPRIGAEHLLMTKSTFEKLVAALNNPDTTSRAYEPLHSPFVGFAIYTGECPCPIDVESTEVTFDAEG